MGVHRSPGGLTPPDASKSGKLDGGGFRSGSTVKPTKWTNPFKKRK